MVPPWASSLSVGCRSQWAGSKGRLLEGGAGPGTSRVGPHDDVIFASRFGSRAVLALEQRTPWSPASLTASDTRGGSEIGPGTDDIVVPTTPTPSCGTAASSRRSGSAVTSGGGDGVVSLGTSAGDALPSPATAS